MKNKRFILIYWIMIGFSIHSYTQQWKIISSKPIPSTMGFNGLSVVDKNTVWLAANDYSLWGVNGGSSVAPSHLIRIMKTTDGGDSWNTFEVAEAKGRATLEICALDSLTAWFSTNQFNSTDTRPIFKTKDGGLTWKKVETPSYAGGNLIHFFDNNDGIVVNGGSAATSIDGGDTWTKIPASKYGLFSGEYLVVSGSATSRAAYTDSTMVFGTDRGRIIFSKDRGKTFTFKQVGAINDLVNAITILNAKHWIVIAPENSQIVYDNPKVFQTLDAGITWTELPRAENRISHIAKQPGTLQTIFTCSIDTIGIQRSINGMEEPVWEETLTEDLYAYGMAFSKDGAGYAVTGDINEENFIIKWSNDINTIDEIGLENSSVKVFPNPITDIMTYQLPLNAGNVNHISVSDVGGKIVFHRSNSLDNIINIQDWPKGIYFLKFETHSSRLYKRIIKI